MPSAVKLAKRLVPGRTKRWIRKQLYVAPKVSKRDLRTRPVIEYLRGRVPIETLPSFAGDSLISWHNAEFLEDPAFIQAVARGVERGSWTATLDVRWRFHVILWAAARAARMEGDFVECGVNRGGFARAIVDYVDFGQLDKTFYLMDTFNGLVEKYITPEERAMGVSRESFAKFSESYDDVAEAFKAFPNVQLVRGPIPDTLPLATTTKVAFLSIDMNVMLPEIAAANYFWDRLVSGAIVILDDYGHGPHRLQKHAFDEFAAAHGVQVLMLPTGQGLMFKP